MNNLYERPSLLPLKKDLLKWKTTRYVFKETGLENHALFKSCPLNSNYPNFAAVPIHHKSLSLKPQSFLKFPYL